MTNNKYNVDIDKLTTLNLFQLREVGSKVGVRNPTALKADALHPYYPCLNIPSYVKKCHHLGIAVHPWTINDERTAKKLMNMGVDALITNVPAKLVALKK